MGLVELMLGGLLLWWFMLIVTFLWIVIGRERQFRHQSRLMAEARSKYGIKPEGENPRGPRYSGFATRTSALKPETPATSTEVSMTPPGWKAELTDTLREAAVDLGDLSEEDILQAVRNQRQSKRSAPEMTVAKEATTTSA